jgi:hypothetical protein
MTIHQSIKIIVTLDLNYIIMINVTDDYLIQLYNYVWRLILTCHIHGFNV